MKYLITLFFCCSIFPVLHAGSKTLVDFTDSKIDTDKIQYSEKSTASIVNGVLSANLPSNEKWPTLTFKGPWDLSDYDRVSVRIKNTGSSGVSIVLRIDNPGSDGIKNCINSRLFFAPDEEKVLSTRIVRKSEAKEENLLVGMMGTPSGYPSPQGIDASKISQILIFKFQNNQDNNLQISNICAEGKFTSNADKKPPLVDCYGQYRYADWPGKIKSDTELKEALKIEMEDIRKNPRPSSFDIYGGWADGPQLEKTGRFRTEKYKGKWHLVDPDGRLFFSLGMNHVNIAGTGSYTPVTLRERLFETLPTPNDMNNRKFYISRKVYTGFYNGKIVSCFSFSALNLSKKYGQDWETAASAMAHPRLQSWGFNTIGNWSDKTIVKENKTPYTVGVALAGSGARVLGGGEWKIGKCWDVYDKDFPFYVDKALSELNDTAKSQWCIGIFFDNELYWDEDFGITALKSGKNEPAKQVLIQDLQQKYTSVENLNTAWKTTYKSWSELLEGNTAPEKDNAKADLDAFYLKTAELYYKTVRDAIKTKFPGCLYLGSRFARVTPLAYTAAAKYCDLVSFNLYRGSLASFAPPADIDAPLLVGEFHFGATDRGMWSSGLVQSDSQEERAKDFTKYIQSALEHPLFVGCHWFEYCDEPLTGRAFDGENYAHGFLSGTDSPYPELIKASRDISKKIYDIRNGKSE